MTIEERVRSALNAKISEKTAQAQTERKRRLRQEQAKIDLHNEKLSILSPWQELLTSTLMGFSDMPEFYAIFGPIPGTEFADVDGNMRTNFSREFAPGGQIESEVFIMSAGQNFAYGITLSIDRCNRVVARLGFMAEAEGANGWCRIPEETVFLDTSSPARLQETLIQGMSGFVVQHTPSQSIGYGS